MKLCNFLKTKLTNIKLRINYISKHIKIYKGVEIMNSNIDNYCNLSHDCSILNSNIGLRSSIGRYSIVRNAEIGKYCSISWFVTIGASYHPIDRISTHAFTYRKQFGIVKNNFNFDSKKVIIGNDVWIGCNAIIMPGITIGNGAIIGAGAIVTKNVEPYSIVVGNPAKEIKKRFDEKIVNELENIK